MDGKGEKLFVQIAVRDWEKEIIEQYFLQDEQYELLVKSNNGEINSIFLPDFKIPIRAVFDEKINIEILEQILKN